MRVITGIARGRKLRTLEGMDVRPTTEKVKEAIFSSIQFELEGARVLDLFAGSGQLGIEALSRGASKAVFVDAAATSIAVVEENLQNTGLAEAATVLRRSAADYLRATGEQFDFAFLDPPYHNGTLLEILPLLESRMVPGGKIICEHEKELDLPQKIGGLDLQKAYKYGKIKVTVYSVTMETGQEA